LIEALCYCDMNDKALQIANSTLILLKQLLIK